MTKDELEVLAQMLMSGDEYSFKMARCITAKMESQDRETITDILIVAHPKPLDRIFIQNVYLGIYI